MKSYLYLVCLALLAACNHTEKPLPPVDLADQVFEREGDYAASHILVAFTGAQAADEKLQRSAEEAQQLATELLGKVLATPESFEQLARSQSDGSSAAVDGSLGTWKKGDFVAEFEQAVEAMLVGEILDHLVKSDFGYHIIRRDPLAVVHYTAQGFVISFVGHPENPPTVHRSKEEAHALAMSLVGKVNGENFAEMANKYNDLGEGPRSMGVVVAGDPWPKEALDLLKSLGYGQVGGPVEFPMGYVFLQREKAVCYAGSVVLVAWSGAEGARRSVVRTQPAALALANDLQAKLKANPELFTEFASSQSDSPRAAKSGHMGLLFRGSIDASFSEAFEALEEGEFTQAPVETRYGYYIIKRHKAP